VCEYIKGSELSLAIENHGKISEDEVKSWFKKILLGVHHIHESKIIHRDLKLENIIMRFKIYKYEQVIDEIKIVDFGCGVNSDTKAKGLMGTPQ